MQKMQRPLERAQMSNYQVGDELIIRSKVMQPDPYETRPYAIHVCTSVSNGYDTFDKRKCNIVDGYVIHKVVITGIDTFKAQEPAYHTRNDLSLSGMGWQGVRDCDIVKGIRHSPRTNFWSKISGCFKKCKNHFKGERK